MIKSFTHCRRKNVVLNQDHRMQSFTLDEMYSDPIMLGLTGPEESYPGESVFPVLLCWVVLLTISLGRLST